VARCSDRANASRNEQVLCCIAGLVAFFSVR
jgi:hypothetical protein